MGPHNGVQAQVSRRQMTPNQIAARALSIALGEWRSEIGDDRREAYRRDMMNLESLRYMNMRTLAVALVIRHQWEIKLNRQVSIRDLADPDNKAIFEASFTEAGFEKYRQYLMEGVQESSRRRGGPNINIMKRGIITYIILVLNHFEV